MNTKNKNTKNVPAAPKIGRPAAKIVWPKRPFTVLDLINGKNGNSVTTVPGMKHRVNQGVVAKEIFNCGSKKGGVGRPQFVYSVNPNDVPKELRDPAINGAIRSYNRINGAPKNAKAANEQVAA